MIITEDEVEQTFRFGSIQEVHLKEGRGTKYLRIASVSPEKIQFFNRNRMVLSAMGVVLRPKYKGGPSEMEFAWWQDKPAYLQIKEQAAVEGSKATSSDLVVPMGGGIRLRSYQAAGVEYMKSRKGFLLADEMGLGKTLQIVGVANCRPNIHRILVICPKSVRAVWFKEFNRGLVKKRSIAFAEEGVWPTSDIVITHYDVAHKFEPQMTGLYWDLVILDEGHYLRNKKTRRSRVILGARADTKKGLPHCAGIPSRVKCITTGTPLANSPMDLFPYLRWADPEFWGTYTSFQRDYVFDPRGHHALNKRLMEWGMLRRLKKDVMKDLPPKIRNMLVIDAHTEEQRAVIAHDQELIGRFRQAMTQEMDEDSFMRDIEKNVLKALKIDATELSRMRQATARALFPDAVAQAREILASKEKLVVYAHHRQSILDLLEEFRDMGAVHWMGGMDGSKLGQHIAMFQRDSRCRVFVASVLATGTGVDGLQEACSTCLFTEGDWLSVTMDQAEDRLHRFGQLSTVESYHMALAGSVGIRILQLSIEKRRIADRVLDGSEVAAPASSVIAPRSGVYEPTPLFGKRPGKQFGTGLLPGIFG